MMESLSRVTEANLQIYGPQSSTDRTALAAFNSRNVHASDIAFFLDQEGVCVRAGHHCTQPLHRILGAAGSTRASLYIYNDRSDVDALVHHLQTTVDMFNTLKK
jgi:cysteine desulfurase/selenocysteine lyase